MKVVVLLAGCGWLNGPATAAADAETPPERGSSSAVPEIDRLNEEGFSQLHVAALAGDAAAARRLLSQGADPNIRQGRYRGTPLQYAAGAGHVAVVRLLLKHEADVDAADFIGRTPLMWGAMKGRTDVVRELLRAGADSKAATATGWTAAEYALKRGHREAAAMLEDKIRGAATPQKTPFEAIIRPHATDPVPVVYFILTAKGDSLNQKAAVLAERLEYVLETIEALNKPNAKAAFFLRNGPSADGGVYTSFTLRELREITALAADRRAARLSGVAWAFGTPERLADQRRLSELAKADGTPAGDRSSRDTSSKDAVSQDAASQGPAAAGTADVVPDCRVHGRVESAEYRRMAGGIERAIVAVRKLPSGERIALENFRGEAVELRLPPGEYALEFSAVGTRGATFQGSRREISVGGGRKELDFGAIDLAISRTTSLYGRPAPELSGIVAWKNTEPLRLKDLCGKVVLLDFFAYYCSICHAHKPDLARLREKYADQGLVVLAVHDGSLATLVEMNEKMDPILRRVFAGEVPALPMALDGSDGESVFGAYGIGAVPSVILIDGEGRVVRRFHHAGVPELEPEVRRLLTPADAGPEGAADDAGDRRSSAAPVERSVAQATTVAPPAGRQIRTLDPAHDGPLAAIAYSPDGRLLATAAMHERGGHAPNLVKLRNPATGELQGALNTAVGDPPIDCVISKVAFSPDGGKLAVSGGVLYHGQIVLLDLKSGKVVWSHQDVADTTDVGIAFSPDGRRLASTGVAPRDKGGTKRKQQVSLWDVATGERVRAWEGHDGYLMSVAFAPDGRTLAAASSNGAVDLWDPDNGELRRRLRAPDFELSASGYVFVAFAPDGKRLAVAQSDGALRLWNPLDGTLEREFPIGKRRPHTIAFSPDGKFLACGNWVEESISLWNVRTGSEQALIPKEAGGGTVFAFSSDGRTLATGAKEGTVRLVPIDMAE